MASDRHEPAQLLEISGSGSAYKPRSAQAEAQTLIHATYSLAQHT